MNNMSPLFRPESGDVMFADFIGFSRIESDRPIRLPRDFVLAATDPNIDQNVTAPFYLPEHGMLLGQADGATANEFASERTKVVRGSNSGVEILVTMRQLPGMRNRLQGIVEIGFLEVNAPVPIQLRTHDH